MARSTLHRANALGTPRAILPSMTTEEIQTLWNARQDALLDLCAEVAAHLMATK